jgi:hypothetical protein
VANALFAFEWLGLRRGCGSVDVAGGAQSGFDGALNPSMNQRAVLAGKVDTSFRSDNVLVQLEVLARFKQGESAAGEFIFVPHLAGADFEFVVHLGVNLGDIFQRGGNAISV